jgi:two-component system sensor histidine kinase ChiS
MGPVIREHHGFIDKYIGDAIMGLFADSADDAFRAAIAMHRALVAWNGKRVKHGLQAVAIGAGIHRGSLMLGTIGENERMEGTVISDTVNLAARIEGLTRLYGAAVLTSQATCDALEQPQDFQLRRLDRVRVKGKRQIIDLYELLDALPESDQAARTRTAATFAGALQLYLDGSFSAARQAFMDVARDDPGDGAARLFVERCQKLQQSAETGTWDGTTILKSK